MRPLKLGDKIALVIITALVLLFGFAALSNTVKPTPAKADPADKVHYDAASIVKLKQLGNDRGHGSGVLIDSVRGLIVTAAHVADELGSKAIAVDDRGVVHKAEVLWINKRYDIALVRAHNMRRVEPARIDCRSPFVGEELVQSGYALDYGLVHMSAIVAAEASPWKVWGDVLRLDGSSIWGMSGGGAFDAQGELVGIVVGTGIFQTGYVATWVRMGFTVPASRVCELLAR